MTVKCSNEEVNMMLAEFTCKKCDESFEVDWGFGDEVTCPACETAWETGYDMSWDGVMGPWLESKKVENPVQIG